MVEPIVVELAIIVVVATFLGLLFRVLRQPLILSYIATGVLLGASFFNVIEFQSIIEAFSTLGVAFLLFLVGLTLNVKVLREVGKVAIVAGIGQIIFTAILGTLLALALGYGWVEAVFIGIALTFSSTIIIVKLLLDRDEIETLHGKIALGILIVQDIVAIFALLVLTSLGSSEGLQSLAIGIILGGFALAAAAFILSRFVISRLFFYFAESQELLFLSALSWLAIISGIAEFFGFSVEIGAFIAGVTLAPLPFSYNISGKVKYLRDLFLVLFFVSLGTRLVVGSFYTVLYDAIIFSIFLLVVAPLIIFIVMKFMGYTARTSFKIGISLGQISEFSLIFMALGNTAGYVSDEVTVMSIIVAVITIAASTYFIVYADRLYDMLPKRIIQLLERGQPHFDVRENLRKKKIKAVFLGYGTVGQTVFENMNLTPDEVLIVDFDPRIARKAIDGKLNFLFADVTDLDTLDLITSLKPKVVFSTVEDVEPNEVLLKRLSGQSGIQKVLISENAENAHYFYKHGADLVIVPSITASEQISIMLNSAFKDQKLLTMFKEQQLKVLEKFK